MPLTYAAAHLTADGQLVRHPETAEIMNIQIGDFDNEADAIEQACLELECTHTINGVVLKGNNRGGFMIVNTQELHQL